MRFDKHHSEPQKSLNAYLNERRLQLGKSIADKHKVYLDTKYWLLLRDNKLGRLNDPSVAQLLDLLQEAVRSGRVICPISADVFAEILKQTDPMTRRCSAELIDTMSCGITLVSPQERCRMEILHFVQTNGQIKTNCHPLAICVWTKIPHTFGLIIPSDTPFSLVEEKDIQKACLDRLWNMTLSEMLHIKEPDATFDFPRMHGISDELNEGKIAHADENRTFNEMYLSELGGLLDGLKPDFAEMMVYLFQQKTGLEARLDEATAGDGLQMLINAIYHGFRMNRLTTELPSIRINATLHAAIRCNGNQKYKPNDLHDISHAVAALPYCDTFLTEKSLKHLLTRRDLALDDLYGCRVFCRPDEALSAIRDVLD